MSIKRKVFTFYIIYILLHILFILYIIYMYIYVCKHFYLLKLFTFIKIFDCRTSKSLKKINKIIKTKNFFKKLNKNFLNY